MACGAAPGVPGSDLSGRFLASSTPRLRRALRLGLIAGTVYFAGTLYWIVEVLTSFGGMSLPVATGVNALLVVFLALFPALALLGTAVMVLRWGRLGLLGAPAVWVASELARTYFLGGFPWVLLGYSQATVLPIAQLASVGGVYGVSGLVALVSALLAYAVLASGWNRRRAVAAAIVVPLLVGAWGTQRLERSELLDRGTVLRVGLIQGNVAQADKWDPNERPRIVRDYLAMSRDAASQGAELVIWPESATPFVFEDDLAGTAAIRTLVSETGLHLLFGSNRVEHSPRYRIFNAAYMVRPDGQTTNIYRKIHLVPFGEYVPLSDLLFFARPLVESASAFSPGDRAVTMSVGERLVSTAICYEVVYPNLIRRFVLAGSELLTTITNDAWYGLTSAPHQHFEQASMRAIEQGRFLVRAANTGISGVVDPYGRVLDWSGIFEPATIVADVRLIDDHTVYGTTGDLFAYLSALLSVALLGVSPGRPRTRRGAPGR